MTLFWPIDVTDDCHGPGLEPAVALLQRLVARPLAIGVFIGFLLGEELFHVSPQSALVALHIQYTVGLFLDDLGGDIALAAHGIDGHLRTLYRQYVGQPPDGCDLVRLVRDLHFASTSFCPAVHAEIMRIGAFASPS